MMQCYKAIVRNEGLIPATAWMNLENIMVNARRQIQKTMYFTITFRWNASNREIYRQKIDQ